MIYSTITVPVNPDGETRLTRAQVWKGLELKARDARQFLPPGLYTRCEFVEESATHFVREATIAGTDLSDQGSEPASVRLTSPSVLPSQPATFRPTLASATSRHCD